MSLGMFEFLDQQPRGIASFGAKQLRAGDIRDQNPRSHSDNLLGFPMLTLEPRGGCPAYRPIA